MPAGYAEVIAMHIVEDFELLAASDFLYHLVRVRWKYRTVSTRCITRATAIYRAIVLIKTKFPSDGTNSFAHENVPQQPAKYLLFFELSL